MADVAPPSYGTFCVSILIKNKNRKWKRWYQISGSSDILGHT